MNPDQEYVLKTVKSRDVHFVRFWFTDVLGRMKSFAVSPNELEAAFEEGMGFDGRNVSGFAEEGAGDLLAYPEASTFQVLPWRPSSDAVARMFCSIRTPDGAPFEADSRYVLQRVLAQAAEAGFEPIIGPEVEYFYFTDASSTTVLDRGGYFDLTSLDSASDLRRDTVLALEKMGIPVEYSHHEVGPSQHEVDLRSVDAMSAADAVMTYKMVVKEIAALHGVYASFMPKPLAADPGSGMHLHIGLFDADDANVFYDTGDASGFNLSDVAKSFVAGLLHHAPGFCLVTNQYVNSYTRLLDGAGAPNQAGWGRACHQAMARIPGYKPAKQSACRIELRNPDPACNPYLALAAVLAAGLDGVRAGMQLGQPLDDCNGVATGAQAEPLPESLGAAVETFAASQLMREVLGDRIHDFLVRNKRAEWRAYLASVSQWELDRYLEVL